MQLSFCRNVRGVGRNGRVKQTKVMANAVNLNFSLPTLLVSGYTQQFAYILRMRRLLILVITCLRDIAKIIYGVIRGVAINVVYMVNRPCASHVAPCQSMRGVFDAKQLHRPVAQFSFTACNRANNASLSLPRFPNENSSACIVIKNLTDMFCGNIGFAHAVAPFKQWCEKLTGGRQSSVSAPILT